MLKDSFGIYVIWWSLQKLKDFWCDLSIGMICSSERSSPGDLDRYSDGRDEPRGKRTTGGVSLYCSSYERGCLMWFTENYFIVTTLILGFWFLYESISFTKKRRTSIITILILIYHPPSTSRHLGIEVNITRWLSQPTWPSNYCHPSQWL